MGIREDVERNFGPKIGQTSPDWSWFGRDNRRLRDDEAWRHFTRGRLSAKEQHRLEGLFEQTDAGWMAYQRSPEVLWTAALRDWILDVLEIDVDVRPGGWVVLRAPDPTPGRTMVAPHRVEMQWVHDPKNKGRRLLSVQVIADEYLEPLAPAPAMDRYMAAFVLRVLDRDLPDFRKLPRRRPKPGQPLDYDFYKRVVDQYDALVDAGYRNPGVELARRMGEPHGTVKSWLSRGRAYLKANEGEESG